MVALKNVLYILDKHELQSACNLFHAAVWPKMSWHWVSGWLYKPQEPWETWDRWSDWSSWQDWGNDRHDRHAWGWRSGAWEDEELDEHEAEEPARPPPTDEFERYGLCRPPPPKAAKTTAPKGASPKPKITPYPAGKPPTAPEMPKGPPEPKHPPPGHRDRRSRAEAGESEEQESVEEEDPPAVPPANEKARDRSRSRSTRKRGREKSLKRDRGSASARRDVDEKKEARDKEAPCAPMKGSVGRESRERVRDEVKKFVQGNRPAEAEQGGSEGGRGSGSGSGGSKPKPPDPGDSWHRKRSKS